MMPEHPDVGVRRGPWMIELPPHMASCHGLGLQGCNPICLRKAMLTARNGSFSNEAGKDGA